MSRVDHQKMKTNSKIGIFMTIKLFTLIHPIVRYKQLLRRNWTTWGRYRCLNYHIELKKKRGAITLLRLKESFYFRGKFISTSFHIHLFSHIHLPLFSVFNFDSIKLQGIERVEKTSIGQYWDSTFLPLYESGQRRTRWQRLPWHIQQMH